MRATAIDARKHRFWPTCSSCALGGPPNVGNVCEHAHRSPVGGMTLVIGRKTLPPEQRAFGFTEHALALDERGQLSARWCVPGEIEQLRATRAQERSEEI